MIGAVELIAQRLLRAIWIIRLILVAALAASLAAIFSPTEAQQLLTPGILVFLWALNAHTLATGFHRVPIVDAEASWWKRVKSRFVRGTYWLFAGLFVLLSLICVWLTFRLAFV